VPVAGGHTVWLWSGREARGTHPSLGMSVERVAHPNRSVATSPWRAARSVSRIRIGPWLVRGGPLGSGPTASSPSSRHVLMCLYQAFSKAGVLLAVRVCGRPPICERPGKQGGGMAGNARRCPYASDGRCPAILSVVRA